MLRGEAFARWKSGLGLDFDGLVLGNKDDHAQRFYTTKKRKAPTSNLNAVNAKELVFDEDLKKCRTRFAMKWVFQDKTSKIGTEATTIMVNFI